MHYLVLNTLVLVGALLLAPCIGLHEAYEIRGVRTWVYVSKFCLMPKSGKTTGVFKYNVTFPSNTSLAWQVYYDGSESWDKVRKGDVSINCYDKVNLAQTKDNSACTRTNRRARRSLPSPRSWGARSRRLRSGRRARPSASCRTRRSARCPA